MEQQKGKCDCVYWQSTNCFLMPTMSVLKPFVDGMTFILLALMTLTFSVITSLKQPTLLPSHDSISAYQSWSRRCPVDYQSVRKKHWPQKHFYFTA